MVSSCLTILEGVDTQDVGNTVSASEILISSYVGNPPTWVSNSTLCHHLDEVLAAGAAPDKILFAD